MRDAQTISATLREAFSPTHLEVIDDSERHHGHAGWQEGGNTHFRVVIASPHFDAMSRVEKHRAVNEALKAQFDDGLHALSIKFLDSAAK